VDSELSELLAGIQYAGMSVVHLGIDQANIDHPLIGTGFLVPRKEAMSINGTLWMSSIFPNRSPEGKVLLTAYLGGARNPKAIDWSDRRSVDTVLGDIGSVLGINVEPEMVYVHRDHQALPLYHGRYFHRCRVVRQCLEQLPGLSLQANYLGGISIRDRLVTSKATAMQVMEQLGSAGDKSPTETIDGGHREKFISNYAA